MEGDVYHLRMTMLNREKKWGERSIQQIWKLVALGVAEVSRCFGGEGQLLHGSGALGRTSRQALLCHIPICRRGTRGENKSRISTCGGFPTCNSVTGIERPQAPESKDCKGKLLGGRLFQLMFHGFLDIGLGRLDLRSAR